jgi:[ribosomal protein S18]-alanine N-acetyltransferase
MNGEIVTEKTAVRRFLDAIRIIEEETFTPPWKAGDFSSELDDAASRVLLLIVEERVAGYLFAKQAADEISINKLCVHKDFRGKGFGTMLVRTLQELYRGICSKIFLEVDSSNTPAIALYRRCGFTVSRVRKQIYANGADAFEMYYD